MTATQQLISVYINSGVAANLAEDLVVGAKALGFIEGNKFSQVREIRERLSQATASIIAIEAAMEKIATFKPA